MKKTLKETIEQLEFLKNKYIINFADNPTKRNKAILFYVCGLSNFLRWSKITDQEKLKSIKETKDEILQGVTIEEAIFHHF